MVAIRDIREVARRAGFDLCGAAPVRTLDENRGRMRRWIEAGCSGGLGYLERNFDKRFDPALLVEGARTVVVCAINYRNRFSGGYPAGCRAPGVASYALMRDYHAVIRERLDRMFDRLREIDPALDGRAFVDTAPLAEKSWAVEAGLGWIGRHSLLITPRYGSFVLLGELVLTVGVDRYDTPYAGEGCGTCRRCVTTCPVGALRDDRTVDARRCIARRTIERIGPGESPPGPEELYGWIFGCDRCQQVCPHNVGKPLADDTELTVRFDPAAMDGEAWRALTAEEFARQMGNTPLVRSGLERLRRNLPESGRDPSDDR